MISHEQLQSTTGEARLFAVVDVETTGLRSTDRIVEVAVVVIDSSGKVVDEYDTLINPQRDVGPTDIHGISASMIEAAPTFEEVATSIARLIQSNILVAHNLAFDQRMLGGEYKRLGATLNATGGVCTLRLTGQKLNLACERHGVPLTSHHRALADARAAAQLLGRFLGDIEATRATIGSLTTPHEPRTLRRESVGSVPYTPLQRLLSRTPYPCSQGAVLCYLDALDRALDDRMIESCEWEQLHELAVELGLGDTDVYQAKRRYLRALIYAALRDKIVTPAEHSLVSAVARALGISDEPIPEITAIPQLRPPISFGTRICFTGAATDAQGRAMDRDELETIAATCGLQPVSSVTKKCCDLLVASDPSSASGKAKKARSYGIPIVSIEKFLECVQFARPT